MKIYFFFHDHWVESVASTRKKIIPVLARRRSAGNVYAIDLDSDWLGLGARIVKTIEILLYCDERNLTPLIRYDYHEKKKPKDDFFGELFYYKNPDPASLRSARFTHIRDLDELGWEADYNAKLKLKTAASIFYKYLGIQPEILREVDDFVQQQFKGNQVLGIHYRGTDKTGEAPLVRKDTLLRQIHKLITDRPEFRLIFISTDDDQIIQFLKQAALPLPVIFRADAIRSTDGDQFHRKVDNSKSVVNRDAIVNLLLLSRCDYLLKTASILSDCSVIFNPSIEVKLISRPHTESLTWWPCREIIENQRIGEELYS